jgi:hypothetical protein
MGYSLTERHLESDTVTRVAEWSVSEGFWNFEVACADSDVFELVRASDLFLAGWVTTDSAQLR